MAKSLTPESLRARANDSASLLAICPARCVAAVKATLLHLADLMEDKPALVVKPEPVKKRKVE